MPLMKLMAAAAVVTLIASPVSSQDVPPDGDLRTMRNPLPIHGLPTTDGERDGFIPGRFAYCNIPGMVRQLPTMTRQGQTG